MPGCCWAVLPWLHWSVCVLFIQQNHLQGSGHHVGRAWDGPRWGMAWLGSALVMKGCTDLLTNPNSLCCSWEQWEDTQDIQLGEVINTVQVLREIGRVFLAGLSCGSCVCVLELQWRESSVVGSLWNCSHWINLGCLNCTWVVWELLGRSKWF